MMQILSAQYHAWLKKLQRKCVETVDLATEEEIEKAKEYDMNR